MVSGLMRRERPVGKTVDVFETRNKKKIQYMSTERSGPSSKLTMSLVNDSLKFTSSDTQICWMLLLKKFE